MRVECLSHLALSRACEAGHDPAGPPSFCLRLFMRSGE